MLICLAHAFTWNPSRLPSQQSQNSLFAGRLLIFLAKLLPLMERSGVNLQVSMLMSERLACRALFPPAGWQCEVRPRFAYSSSPSTIPIIRAHFTLTIPHQ